MRIQTMAHVLDETQALDYLRQKDRSIRVKKVDQIYYPYAKLDYGVKLNRRLGAMDRKMMCNIDLVHGRPAVGQGKAQMETREIAELQAVAKAVPEDTWDQIGHDFVMKVFLSKMKILRTPEISLKSRECFHKPFYLAQCLDREGLDYFVLVDGIDGSFTFV